MAVLSASKDLIIFTFLDVSLVYKLNGDSFEEKLLEHKSTFTKEESENSTDGNSPICSAISSNFEYYTCCIYKDLYLWTIKDWTLLSKRTIHRSVSALIFSPKSDKIAVADKSGDVYLFSVENAEQNGELILGHISMLLDILITPNNKYVVTCDRDEKIRISCYPNAYNIESYCLGHEEFVTCLCILPHNETVLVSGSGDGTIRFWDYLLGKQLLVCNCNEVETKSQENSKAVISSIACTIYSDSCSVLCVHLVSVEGIIIYNISSDNNNEIKSSYKEFITLDSEPLCFSFSMDHLWIFKQNVDECLTIYNYSKDKNEFSLDTNLVSLMKKSLEKHIFLFETVFKKERHLSTLYKRRYDNVQEYLTRKMMRIEHEVTKSNNLSSIAEVS